MNGRTRKALLVLAFACAVGVSCTGEEERACQDDCDVVAGAAGAPLSSSGGAAAGTGGVSASSGGSEGGFGGRQPEDETCLGVPEAFLLTGCGVRQACQALQEDCDVGLFCEGDRYDVPMNGAPVSLSEPEDRLCTVSMDDDGLVGECQVKADSTCALSLQGLLPHPACVELPPVLDRVQLCGEAVERGAEGKRVLGEDCAVAQDGCALQLLCDGGSTRLSAVATDTGLNFETEYARCSGKWEGAQLIGECEPLDEEGDFPVACPLLVDARLGSMSSCEQTAPSDGFALSGCTRDGNICHMTQRGCVWNVTCGAEVYSGRMAEDNVFEFTSELGADCRAQVIDGDFVGHCEWGAEFCDFSPGELEADATCVRLPAELELDLCGGRQSCRVTQNGCDWQASCAQGLNTYYGEITADAVSFKANDGSECTAALESDSSGFTGTCESTTCGASSLRVEGEISVVGLGGAPG